MINKDQERKDSAEQRSGWAYERTQMATVRTYFAMLRTGLAIAGGGALITSILARSAPDWVVYILAAVFVVVGFAIMFIGLGNYNQIISQLPEEDGPDGISLRLMIALTVVVQLAVIAVLVIFLWGF